MKGRTGITINSPAYLTVSAGSAWPGPVIFYSVKNFSSLLHQKITNHGYSEVEFSLRHNDEND
jgi:hypothetical protein